MLREAAAARRSALAVGANVAPRDRHPAPLETIDEPAGSCGAATASDAVAAAGIGVAVALSMFPPSPPSPVDASRRAHENDRCVVPPPPPPPPKNVLLAHAENGMCGEGRVTPADLVSALPTPPPPVQAPPALPPNDLLPPPPPPPKPAAAAGACPPITAVAPSQIPTPTGDVHVPQGITAASVVLFPATGAEAAATSVKFACGEVLEGEYELEKVGCTPRYCGCNCCM